MENADRIVAVSQYTATIVNKLYDVPWNKLEVVHNGIGESFQKAADKGLNEERERTVIYLGRVTFQKGPDWFVKCAEKVLRKDPTIKFSLAGSGDMLQQCRILAKEAGIDHKVNFPGFLKGQKVKDALARASLYMMPSVSEPFGISALEAASLGTASVISNQSGVGEVLRHTLKADFWDTDLMAEYVTTAMNHKELRNELATNASRELSGITWSRSATKTRDIYQDLT